MTMNGAVLPILAMFIVAGLEQVSHRLHSTFSCKTEQTLLKTYDYFTLV